MPGFAKLSPPERLLLGPGPCNAAPAVLAAQSLPLVGHMDPFFIKTMDECQMMLREILNTKNAFTLPISATGSGGMEATIHNVIEPGDKVVVGINGVFGGRMAELVTRAGGIVTRVEQEWGKSLDIEKMKAVIAEVKPVLTAFVHAETSTGVLQPVQEIADAAHAVGSLVLLDCVTSISGSEIRLDDWGVDIMYSGTQKCLGVPPGLAPVSFSPLAMKKVMARTTKCSSWYFDVSLLAGYYGDGGGPRNRAYHHTAPVSAVFGLHEGLRLVLEEGLESRFVRHKEVAAELIAGLAKLGLEPKVDADVRLPQLTLVSLPESLQGAPEAAVRSALLNKHNIEIGGGLGALAGKVWRIGMMGVNANSESVKRLMAALEVELPKKE